MQVTFYILSRSPVRASIEGTDHLLFLSWAECSYLKFRTISFVCPKTPIDTVRKKHSFFRWSIWNNPRAASATRALLRLTPCHWACLRPPKRKISGTPNSLELTGGEYKTWERIHRGIADPRLLAIPASWSRVADSNPNWRRVYKDLLHLLRYCAPLSRRLYHVCSPRCQRDMLTWRHPRLPPTTQFTITYELSRGQSRLTYITGNEGCVRYPT